MRTKNVERIVFTMKSTGRTIQALAVFSMIILCITGCAACSSDTLSSQNRDILITSASTLSFTEEVTIEKDSLDSSVIYDRDNAAKTDAGNYSFQNISPGFSAISDVFYTVDQNTDTFSFVITWVDTGNPVSVGLLNEENKAFVISLEGGTASCNIDLSNLPAGKYNVIVVHQGKYDPVVNGAISYHFSKK